MWTLHFDGSCAPKNPESVAAFGWILESNGQTIGSGHDIIGPNLGNNYAEFYGLYQGFLAMSRIIGEERGGILQVRGDSKLVIQIMNKHWRATSDKLYFPAYKLALQELISLRKKGLTVFLDWIPREQNTETDKLSKKHLTKV